MNALPTSTLPRTAPRQGVYERLAAIAPWTAVLVITGLFQIFRGAPGDGAIFLVPAALLLADAVGALRALLAGLRFRPRHRTVLAVAVVAGVLLIVTPRHGWGDGVVLVGLATFTLPTIWPDRFGLPVPTDRMRFPAESLFPSESRVSAIRNAAIAWGVVAVASAARELVSFYAGMPSDLAAEEHPTISILFDPVLSNELGRGAFVAIWLIIGVSLLGRGRSR